MSLHAAAQNLAQRGRGHDDTLVHMSHRELQGLQALAQAKGGSLTINPKTGLPEAGFLEQVLPIVAAAAATYFTAGAAAPMLMSAGMGATSAGILAGAGAGALISGGTAAIQGGNVGQAALMGGIMGGIGGGIGAPGEAPTAPTEGLGSGLKAAVPPNAAGPNAGLNVTGEFVKPIGINPGTGAPIDPLAGVKPVVPPEGVLPGSYNVNPNTPTSLTTFGARETANNALQQMNNPNLYSLNPQVAPNAITPPPQLTGEQIAAQNMKDPNASWWSKQTPWEKAGYSTAGTALLAEMTKKPTVPTTPEEESRLKRISPNFQAQGPIQPNPYYTTQYPVYAAGGGLMDAYQGGGPVERMSNLNTAINPQGGLYPQGMVDKTQYATPSQRPTSMEMLESEPSYQRSDPMISAAGMYEGGETSKKKKRASYTGEDTIASSNPYEAGIARLGNAMNMAQMPQNVAGGMQPVTQLGNLNLATGGALGGYSDGGRMLKGPGDGMSDSIPGVIGNKQPARLADGEFVVPADVVSHLGNGSTDAGAKKLYSMMDKVREARTGKKKQAPAVQADRLLPRMA